MQFRERLSHIFFILLCAVAFSISLPYIFASISVGVLSACWLFQFNGKEIKQRFLNRRMVGLWLLFFTQLAISYFYSDNKAQSAVDLQKKLSLFILPIVIGLGPTITSKKLEYIFTSFVLGLMLIGLFCIGKGCGHYLKTGLTDKLFYHALVEGLNANAVYYASYTIFAVGILMLFDFEHTFLSKKLWRITALIITTTFLILLSSKLLSVLLILVVLPLYFYKQSRGRKVSSKQLLVVAAIALAGISVILFTENPIKTRYKEILVNNSFVKGTAPTDGQELVFNNFSLRVFLWKMAWENMEEHNLWLTGCGNGDVVALQKERIAAYDARTGSLFKQPDLSNFNLHNTYLQALMTIGIPGLLVFILMTITPFAFLKRMKHKEVFLVFLISYILFMLQESALQTQAGIMYFGFTSQLLLLFYYSEKDRRVELTQS